MISFFSSKFGPKNSNFGIQFSTRQQDNDKSHQIRSRSLSITTVPIDLSYFGGNLLQTSIFLPLRKQDSAMWTNFSTNSANPASSKGSKRDLPWKHAKSSSEHDKKTKLQLVVKRTDGHGLVPASCRLGLDDSHGVAESRKSSGASNKSTVYSLT